MKEINYPQGQLYTMMHDVLTPCKIESITFNGTCEVLETRIIVEGETEPTIFDRELTYYHGEDDFRIGKIATCFIRPLYEGGNIDFDEADHISLNAWVMENGEPICKTFQIIEATFTSKSSLIESVRVMDEKGYSVNCETYRTRQECLANNIYRVKDENGNEIERKGIALKLQLTDEQRYAIGAIQEAFKYANQLGLEFFWDYDAEEMEYVSNREVNVESVYYGDEPSSDNALCINDYLQTLKISHGWISSDGSVYATDK